MGQEWNATCDFIILDAIFCTNVNCQQSWPKQGEFVLCNVFTPTRKTSARLLTCIAVKRRRKTQIHERRRGCIHCGSIEYTLDGANAFTVL